MEALLKGSIELPYVRELLPKLSKYNYYCKDDTIYYGCKLSKDKKTVYIPRDIIKFTNIFPEIKIKDLRISPKVDNKINLIGLKLKDYQEKSAVEIEQLWQKSHTDVILRAPTGWGKSYVVSYFLSKLQLRTCILVDKTLLAHQMYSEISILTDAKVAILSKTSEITDVNIVTYQLLQSNPKMLENLQKSCGFVIADEVHVIAAQTFSATVSGFLAKYRLGLSATPTRSDGLTEAIYDIMGRSVAVGVNPEALHVQVHTIQFPDQFYSGASDYKRKLSSFIKSHKPQVVALVEYLISKGRYVFIAVDTHELQHFYQDAFRKLGIPTEIMSSETKHSDREIILRGVEDGSIKILLGMAVLEKGISIKRLDTIIHLCGASTKEKVTQLIGRLKREHEEKRTPLFIDFWFNGSLHRQQGIRMHTYKSLGKDVTVRSFPNYEVYKSKFN
jgi:superfamily II DNA or RNA helicase